jgi:hypothetical protein
LQYNLRLWRGQAALLPKLSSFAPELLAEHYLKYMSGRNSDLSKGTDRQYASEPYLQ